MQSTANNILLALPDVAFMKSPFPHFCDSRSGIFSVDLKPRAHLSKSSRTAATLSVHFLLRRPRRAQSLCTLAVRAPLLRFLQRVDTRDSVDSVPLEASGSLELPAHTYAALHANLLARQSSSRVARKPLRNQDQLSRLFSTGPPLVVVSGRFAIFFPLSRAPIRSNSSLARFPAALPRILPVFPWCKATALPLFFPFCHAADTARYRTAVEPTLHKPAALLQHTGRSHSTLRLILQASVPSSRGLSLPWKTLRSRLRSLDATAAPYPTQNSSLRWGPFAQPFHIRSPRRWDRRFFPWRHPILDGRPHRPCWWTSHRSEWASKLLSLSPALRWRESTIVGFHPAFSACSVYVPSRDSSKTKVPSTFVLVSIFLSLAFATNVTSTPATGSPETAHTLPSTLPGSWPSCE